MSKKKKHILSRSFYWIENHGPIFFMWLAQGVISIGETLSYFGINIIATVIVSVGVIGTIIASIVEAVSIKDIEIQNQKIASLEETLSFYQSSLDAIIERKLIEIIDSLGLDDRCRISLYRYEEHTDEFCILGRYSKNPIFDQKGRSKYPANQGVIGKAWNEKTHFHTFGDYEKDKKTWKREHKKLGVFVSVANRLNMKSVEMYGFAVDDIRAEKRIAVIIIESVCPGKIDTEYAEKILNNREFDLAELIEDTRQHYSSLAIAKKEEL